MPPITTAPSAAMTPSSLVFDAGQLAAFVLAFWQAVRPNLICGERGLPLKTSGKAAEALA
jgi:hypothetical protein